MILETDIDSQPKRSLPLWLAQGFGLGGLPVAPGTFGSLLGLDWAMLLLWPRNALINIVGTIAGLALCIWACGRAERQLNAKDPSSVVLDEISAMLLCFAVWLTFY